MKKLDNKTDSGCSSDGLASQPNECKTSQPSEGLQVPKSNIGQAEEIIQNDEGEWALCCDGVNIWRRLLTKEELEEC